MGFFDRDDDGPAGAGAARDAGRDAAGDTTEPRPFAAALQPADFALLERLACVTLGRVEGSSLYRVGAEKLPPTPQWAGELFVNLETAAQAWSQARATALQRLHQRAVELDADAVIGARLDRGEHRWDRGVVDYAISGTAIRSPGRSRMLWGPVVCDLAMPAYLKLLDGGWEPAGLVTASAVLFVSQSTGRRWRSGLTAVAGQELGEYSRGFAAARARVNAELRRQAAAAGADGIVGITLEQRTEARRIPLGRSLPRPPAHLTPAAAAAQSRGDGAEHREGVAVTIHAAGTAIRRRSRSGPDAPPRVIRL